jgi:spore maturation protein CgeB
MAEMGWCPSGRLFEAAACGAAILSDCWEGLDAFLSPPGEILVAASSEDATAALDLDEAQIRRIAAAARERVLTDHTSERRADELLRAIARVSVRSREPEPMEA